jgi:hypothetical protein
LKDYVQKEKQRLKPSNLFYLLLVDDVDVFLSSLLVLVLVALGAEVIVGEEEATPAAAIDGDVELVCNVVEEAASVEDEDDEEEEAGRVLVTSVLGPFPPLAQYSTSASSTLSGSV